MLLGVGVTGSALDTDSGRIPIALSAWLDTAGCDAERSERVRRMFRDAPASARRQFQIVSENDGETHFAWQRVVLRAERS